jgi:hypothetical protein
MASIKSVAPRTRVLRRVGMDFMKLFYEAGTADHSIVKKVKE